MNLKEQLNGIPTNDIVHFLPFWENGVKFFTIEGPNKEKVEFSQLKQVLFVFNILLRKA